MGWYKETGRCKDTGNIKWQLKHKWQSYSVKRTTWYKDEKPPIQWKELRAWCKREETIWIHQYHYINLQKNYKEDWSNQTVTTYTNATGILTNNPIKRSNPFTHYMSELQLGVGLMCKVWKHLILIKGSWTMQSNMQNNIWSLSGINFLIHTWLRWK